MKIFQPILTCFLCLLIADIAVRGLHTTDQRNFMCSTQSTSLKLSLEEILEALENASSVSIPPTAIPVT